MKIITPTNDPWQWWVISTVAFILHPERGNRPDVMPIDKLPTDEIEIHHTPCFQLMKGNLSDN